MGRRSEHFCNQPQVEEAGDYAQKKTFGYCERSEEKREEFLKELSEVPAEERVYVDETGMDQDDLYAYGWSARGERCHGKKPGGSKHRVSVIAGLSNGRLQSPFYFNGYTDSQVFNAWLQHGLLPEIGKGKTIIMDNARFHKSAETRRIIEDAGCKLLFLPPYSPDFNPIEHCWFPIKNTARKIMQTITSVESAIHAALLIHP